MPLLSAEGFVIKASIAAMSMLAAPSLAAPCLPLAERVALALPGAASRAEILRPPAGRVRAVAVLIHGSDVADLDNSIVARDGRIVSTPLRDVAVALACAGIATIRYDKRFVTGPAAVDRAAFGKLTLSDLLSDAGAALDTARARTGLAALPQLVFGWSEGSTVAAALAARRPDIAGVILQAPVIDGFAPVLQAQWPRVGLPYLERFASGGAVDGDAVARAAAGPGGIIAQIYVGMVKGFAPADRLNAMLDSNHDGRIDLSGEASPVVARWFADGIGGGLGIYATGIALPGVRDRLAAIRVPILILQGEADGNIDARASASLRGRRGVTVKIYSGLGHTLGPSASPLEDGFLPIAAAPLRDLTRWAVKLSAAPPRGATSRSRRASPG